MHSNPRFNAHQRSNLQSHVVAELNRRMAERGPLTFAEFMSVALYWPGGGYYATREAFGPEGDFFTAPLVHPAFGALLARQLYQMWQTLGAPAPFWVVEPGAGRGRLAADIIAHAPLLGGEFAQAMRYIAVDVRARPVPQGEWVLADTLPIRNVTGVLLANELLDALPVHRVAVRDGHLREIYVEPEPAFEDAPRMPLGPPIPAFREVLGDPSSPALEERLASLGVQLPEGYRTEVCLAASAWTAHAAGVLDAGYLLLIDYGHEAHEYYGPDRAGGTVRCHYQHTVHGDPYVRVGRQDIGAHVEFTSVRQAAEAEGMELAGSTTQGAFLRNLGLEHYAEALMARQEQPEPVRAENRRAMMSLAEPGGLGAFKVLAFCKGVDRAGLAGFGGRLDGLPAGDPPLATPEHMPLQVAPREAQTGMPSWDELLR